MRRENRDDGPACVRAIRPSFRRLLRLCLPLIRAWPVCKRQGRFALRRVAIAISVVAAACVLPIMIPGTRSAEIGQTQSESPTVNSSDGRTPTDPDLSTKGTTPADTASTTSAAGAGRKAPLSGPQIYQRMLHASAWIMARHSANQVAIGTAWLVDRPGRLLVTNHHVVTPWVLGVPTVDPVRVFFPESRNGKLITDPRKEVSETKSYNARIVDLDPRRDLAILQVEGLPSDMEPLTLSREGCRPGETVHSLGNPRGEALWIYTSGTVRQVYRKEVDEFGLRIMQCQCVETQEPVNQGDSGGPVVNDDGQLVAVNQSFLLSREIGVGTLTTFAVDVSEVRAFLDEVRPLLSPNTSNDFYQRALRHLSRGQAALAITDFDEALKRLRSNQDPADILIGRARARSYEDCHSDAVSDLTRALKSKPNDPEILVCRGWALLKANDASSARDDLERVITLAEQKTVREDFLAQAYLGRATIFFNNSDDANYANSTTQAIRSDPRNFRSHVWLAARLDRLGQLKDSLEESNMALKIAQEELDPLKRLEILGRVHSAFRNRAHVYARMNRREEALRDYARAIHWRMRVPPYKGLAEFIVDVGQELRDLRYLNVRQARLLIDNAKKLLAELGVERQTFHERMLYVENKTTNRFVVYFKYHTLADNNEWVWRPGGDLASPEWVAWTVEPDKTSLVSVQGKPIKADRIRYVVKNDRHETVSDKYWSEDLVLVPPQGYQGDTLDRYILPLK